MSRAARSSSSSGCVGGLLRVPKSLGVETRGSPKWCIQTRLTMTRLVSGLSGGRDRASEIEPSAAMGEGRGVFAGEERRNRRGTRSPGWEGFPRTKMRGS